MNKPSKWKAGNLITNSDRTLIVLEVMKPKQPHLTETYYLVLNLESGNTSYYSEFGLSTWTLRA